MSNLGIGRKFARVGIVVLAVAGVTASVTGQAAARHNRHVVHHRQPLNPVVQNAQAALPESSHLGAMRYYGGPKSPMWRAVQ
jgi:hypothetical protein